MLEHLAQRRSDRAGIVGRDEQRFLGRYDVRNSSDAGGDDRDLGGHRLEQRNGCALGPGGQHKRPERSQQACGTRHHAVPVNAVRYVQRRRTAFECLSQWASAHERGHHRNVSQLPQRLDQHIRTLLRIQPPDPPYAKAIEPDSQSATRRLPAEGRLRGRAPCVLQVVDALAGDAALGQVVHERTGNGHDGVEPPQRAALEPLVEAVPRASMRETVDRGNHGNAQATRDRRIHYVRPIAMRMHHVGTQPAAQPRDLGPLP